VQLKLRPAVRDGLFELFYRALNDPRGFSNAVKEFLDMHSVPNRLQ
jgi:hypothetical protein